MSEARSTNPANASTSLMFPPRGRLLTPGRGSRAADDPPARRPDDPAVPHEVAAHPGPLHLARERPPRPRRGRVPVEQRRRIERRLDVRPDLHQIRRAADRDPAPIRPPEEPGRPGRHPAEDPLQVEPAPAGLGPHAAEAELERGDPAPGLAEVAGVEALEPRDARA